MMLLFNVRCLNAVVSDNSWIDDAMVSCGG